MSKRQVKNLALKGLEKNFFIQLFVEDFHFAVVIDTNRVGEIEARFVHSNQVAVTVALLPFKVDDLVDFDLV